MSRWCEGLHISGGFWLLAAWFALVNGWRLLAVILSAALLHELGHLAVLGLLGGRVTGLRISVFGAELTTDAARLSYPREIAAVLAGPGVNLLCGLLLAGHHAWVAAGPTCPCACSICGRCGPWTGAGRCISSSPPWRGPPPESAGPGGPGPSRPWPWAAWRCGW